jgi:hypothetical protein
MKTTSTPRERQRRMRRPTLWGWRFEPRQDHSLSNWR